MDGKRTQAKPLFDLFMSVPLGDSDTAHSVELRYVPAGMKTGAAVSAVSVTLFLAAILYEERRQRTVISNLRGEIIKTQFRHIVITKV